MKLRSLSEFAQHSDLLAPTVRRTYWINQAEANKPGDFGIRSCVARDSLDVSVEQCQFATNLSLQMQADLPNRTVRNPVERRVSYAPKVGGAS